MIETFIAKFGVYIGAAAAVTIGWFTWISSHDERVTARERANTEKVNVEIVKRGHAAANGASNPAVRGVRDPNSVSE